MPPKFQVNVYPSSVQSIFTKNSFNMKHIKLGICAKLFRKLFSASHSMPQSNIAQALARSQEGVHLLMDEVMCGQRAQIELREMEDKEKKVSGMVEELLSSPRKGELAIEANGVSHEEKRSKNSASWLGLLGSVFPLRLGSLEDRSAVMSCSTCGLAHGFHCDSEGPTAGSTACVAIVGERKLIVANAGDSRCVISRRGQIKLHITCFWSSKDTHHMQAHDLSKDHKPDLEEEKERILKAGGFIQIGLHVKPRSGGLRTRAVKIRKDAFCDMSESSRQVFGAFIGRRRMRQHDNDPSSTQQQNLKILVNSVEGLKTSYYLSYTK
ncbi:hypothetical protein V2J09_005357 [Rumex salicifolius]